MDIYDDYEYDYERAVFPRVGEIILYTVRKGDNPYRISKRFNTNVNWVLAMNDLKKDSLIFPNQQLLIPIVYQKPMPLPQPMPPRPPMPPQPRSSLERNEFDMYF